MCALQLSSVQFYESRKFLKNLLSRSDNLSVTQDSSFTLVERKNSQALFCWIEQQMLVNALSVHGLPAGTNNRGEGLDALLTDFQEHHGQPKKPFGLVSFPSVTFLKDKEADRS